MEVFSLQWLLLNYSAKFLPTIKLNYAYCNQRRLLYRRGHITPYCSIQWAWSFRHIAVNSTCQHHCSTAYQVFCSNPHPLDCSISTFHSTLTDSVTFTRCFTYRWLLKDYTSPQVVCLKKVPWMNIFRHQVLYIWGESKLSVCDYTGCVFLLLKHKI